jgi:hypothetical protein
MLDAAMSSIMWRDLAREHFYAPFTAENHYEEPRYHLCGFAVGHPPDYQTLVTALESVR